MIPEELFKKIQQFHFKTRRQANEIYAGQYESAFKGRGMEFAEVRPYQIGDDIRSIDWNVSARFGQPFVKVYHEERELTVRAPELSRASTRSVAAASMSKASLRGGR